MDVKRKVAIVTGASATIFSNDVFSIFKVCLKLAFCLV